MDKLTQFLDPPFSPENLDRYLVRSSILRALESHLPFFGGVILDIGCGQSPYKKLLSPPNMKGTTYLGLDFSDSPIHKNSPEITWEGNRIPLDDCSVDCAICTEVLEHCPDPENVLTEILRVLKPGAPVFFTIPFLWPLHEVPYDEYRYTPFSIERHLRNSGFQNIQIKALGGWDASLAQMLGLWVRRRPLKSWKRKLLSLFIFPFYKLLIKSDKVPERFVESTMITGLSGIGWKENI